MVDFAVYFFICNIFISASVCILFATKKALGTRLSARIQYRLGFIVFAFLALPFIPFRIFHIFDFFNTLTGAQSHYTAAVTDGMTSRSLINTSNQVNDFAVSISRRIPSMAGYLLCFLWVAGICVMIILVWKSLSRLRKIINSSLPLQNSEIRNLYYNCLRQTGINLDIPIYSTAFLKSPVIVGLLKPRIYMPIHTISDYNADSIRFMLLHELQHFRHKDMIANYFINLSGILYWFNPFVRCALKEMKCEREIACDCSVLQMLTESEYKKYGNTLIDFAEKISAVNPFPFFTSMGGSKKQIQKRIANIAGYQKESHCQKMQSRLICLLVMAVFLTFLPVFPTYAGGRERYDFYEENKNITYIDLSPQFDKYRGSFVLYDSGKNVWTIYNKEAALEQIAPNSTYKIYDALLGLESGIITAEHSEMAWNGEDYPFDVWEANQDLCSAMRSSVNWYFQNIDNMAGLEKINLFLQKTDYGNKKTSDDTDLYWTDCSLKISPVEQVELLKKFYHNDFRFSDKNIDAVKKAILISNTPAAALSGKTGTGRVDGQDTNGWFIGYIEKSGHVYYFATNIQGTSDASGSAAAEISLSVLSGMGLWKDGQTNFS